MKPVRLAAACLSLSIPVTGCFGSFELVQRVYDFNESFDDKFVRSVVFWAFVIVPVYELAALADAVVLNVIEFWSGGRKGKSVQRLPDGTELEATVVSENVLRLRRLAGDQVLSEHFLVKDGEGLGTVRTVEGAIVSSGEQRPDGSLIVIANDQARELSKQSLALLAKRPGAERIAEARRQSDAAAPSLTFASATSCE